MFIISDKDSVVRTTEIKPASKDALSTDDAFIIDSGTTVWVWIGEKASKREHQVRRLDEIKVFLIHIYKEDFPTNH